MRRTDWIVFEHAHERSCPWPLEGIEEAGHRHGDEAGVDQPCLDYSRESVSEAGRHAASNSVLCFDRDVPFLAMVSAVVEGDWRMGLIVATSVVANPF